MNGSRVLVSEYAWAWLPFMSSIVMAFIEHYIEPLPWEARGIKTGWDTAVLAFGVMFGILVERKGGGGMDSLAFGLLLILSILVIALIIGLMRTSANKTWWMSAISMGLGGLAMYLPVYWARL